MSTDININRFLDDQGRITQLPRKRVVRHVLLSHLAEKFVPDKDYTEKEVNAICDKWHTFSDFFLLRREMVDAGLLCRERDGSRYWRKTAN
ncbi:MAG: DUF2087 domain-containing protein [Eubacteriales bacterium]